MQVPPLGWEDPLENEMTTTAVFLPRKFHGQRSLLNYSPYSHRESEMTENVHAHIHTHRHTHTPGIYSGSQSQHKYKGVENQRGIHKGQHSLERHPCLF